MATLETQQVDAVLDNTRRRMLTVGGAALAGLALASYSTAAHAAVTDTDILNFALNLEYLEANFYNLAVYGVTIDKLTAAQGGPISTSGGQAAGSGGMVTTKTPFAKVPFTAGGLIQSYATETALEEGKHVSFLQSALGSAAVAQPALNLVDSFNTLSNAAGSPLPATFDPFANETYFLIGAYIFEDVGVSAYHGAAGSISDKVNVLPAAVGIHAVEAYHAGLIRTTLAGMDAVNGNTTLSSYTVAISNLRTKLSNLNSGAPAFDSGIMSEMVALNGSAGQYNSTLIVDADPAAGFSIAAGRTPAQVLAIVTAGNSGGTTATAANTGLFFPNGLNGNIN